MKKILSKIKVLFRLVDVYFDNKEEFKKLIDQAKEVQGKLKAAKSKESEGGKKITGKEWVVIADEGDDVLSGVIKILKKVV